MALSHTLNMANAMRRLEMLKAMYNASTGRPLRESVALITEIRALQVELAHAEALRMMGGK